MATIAVNPVVDLPRTKAIPVLIQVEGLNGATLLSKVYLDATQGSWADSGRSSLWLTLSSGYGRAVLNLWGPASAGDAGESSGPNRINLYEDEDKHIPLASVLLNLRQQKNIRLVSV